MVPGMWFAIDLPTVREVSGLQLETLASPMDYPDGYEVRVSTDGQTWSDPVAKGRGPGPMTEIYFKTVKARHIKITQTGRRPGKFWSIHELQVYGK